MAKVRKTPKTWINAGLKALRTHGVDRLRAETLARDLNATKGSFYWHFKDVPAFHDDILAEWGADHAKRFAQALAKGDTPVTQLRALSTFRPSQLDIAVRAWAVHDKRACKIVEDRNADMLTTLSTLLGDLDATHPDFPGLILASLIAAPKSGDHTETLIDLLLVLK